MNCSGAADGNRFFPERTHPDSANIHNCQGKGQILPGQRMIGVKQHAVFFNGGHNHFQLSLIRGEM